MFDVSTAGLIIALLLGLVLLGVHVAIALGVTSAIGIFMVTGNVTIVERMIASTAAEALRDFTFAVIPLFMLMGEFIGRSGAITDIYVAINKGLRRIPARLAIATVLGNTVFSFVTGGFYRLGRRIQPHRLSGNEGRIIMTGASPLALSPDPAVWAC